MRRATIAFATTILALLWAYPASSGGEVRRQPDDLVGYWSFDHDRGNLARDESGNGNHGLIVGAERVPGKAGRGLRFAKERSYVKVWYRPSLSLGEAISIEAWILPGGPSSQSRVIVSKNDEYALRIDKAPEGGRISFFPHIGSPAVGWEPRVSSTAPPSPNQWHHVVAVWDGRTERLYLDGKLQAEKERTGKPNPNPYPVMIGNWEYPSCHGTCFGGVIDEVRIWGRALTQAEVVAHSR